MKRIRAAVLALGSVVAVQFLVVAAASAHAELSSSNPSDGAALDELPAAVELTFTEVVGEPAALTVIGPDGETIEGGELEVVDDTVRQALTADDAAPGGYAINYQVTSADGHPIGGTIAFTVGAAGTSAGAPPPADPSGDGVDPLLVSSLLVAVAVALGGALLGVQRLARHAVADDAT